MEMEMAHDGWDGGIRHGKRSILFDGRIEEVENKVF